MHWQHLLDAIRARKEELARLEPRLPLAARLPGGASQSAIGAVERKLSRPLPPSYRELLSVHDGVPELYQGTSLLDAHNLARGTFVGIARFVMGFGDIEGAFSTPFQRAPLFPFGIDAAAETIFAWDLSAPRADGELEVVVWMNQIGVRVPDFGSFLELILAMLEGDVAERRRALPPSARRPRVSHAWSSPADQTAFLLQKGGTPASIHAAFAA